MTNAQGLSRNIPTAVKLQVRQECFFGCVICGAMPFDYEHFDPEFVDARVHDAKGIALLCPGHHRDKTAGRLAPQLIADCRANPFNKVNNATWKPALGPGLVRFNFGGNLFSGSSAGFSINGSPVLRVTMPPNGGVWGLTGSFVANGKEMLRFEDSLVTAYSGSWDVNLAGTRLSVSNQAGKVAEVVFDAVAG
jgi:hypothetical protein